MNLFLTTLAILQIDMALQSILSLLQRKKKELQLLGVTLQWKD